VAEEKTPRSSDATGAALLYSKYMTSAYLADANSDELSALRLLLQDIKIEIVGEAKDWPTALAQAPDSNSDILLIDWSLLPKSPTEALEKLRKACPSALVIVLISHLDVRQQAALSAGADVFISKGELPERIAEHIREAAVGISSK
jgi:DNA-binding NarL/FixJ family response regulator